MKQKLLIGAAFCGSLLMMSGSVVVYGQTCTASPSCTELGYTKTQSECGEDGIKCPFGNLWSCSNECEKSGFVYSCTGTGYSSGSGIACDNKYTLCNCETEYRWYNGSCQKALCQIGWIYYEDGTCVTPAAHNTSKVALGVVVYVNSDGRGGQVMSAWPVDEYGYKSNSDVGIMWGDYRTDIPNLPNLDKAPNSNPLSFPAAQDFDSCGNTDKIIAYGGPSTYPAAWAARSYAPTTETKGKWCLPAIGVLLNIYYNQSAVQAGLSTIGGVEFPYASTWSSSENYDRWALISNFFMRGIDSKDKDDDNGYVRPVLEF